MGWDYFENDYEYGGSITFTSFVLSTLTDSKAYIFNDYSGSAHLDVLAQKDALCYQESLAWILDKQVVDALNVVQGNYTLSPLDIDAEGRAPWNVTQAFVTYSLLNTL
jgi:hypothetical protein